MPVTTRSKSRRLLTPLSTLESVEPHLITEPSLKTAGKSIYSTTAKPSTQKPITSTKSRSLKQIPPTTQESPKEPREHHNVDRKNKPQTNTDSSPRELADSVITHTACRACSCPQGLFQYPLYACIRCGHVMDSHEDQEHYWNSKCDNVCERRDLVTSILQLVRDTRVVIVRATPQTGKTTLLWLLGRHILDEHRDLEPILVQWERKAERDGLSYQEFLSHKATAWQRMNSKYRPPNPDARLIYLVDEAQGSYEEPEFWMSMLKNPNTRSQPLFVLVCLYGAADTLRIHDPTNESQASKIDSFRRIELRSSTPGRPCILFSPEETAISVKKWAISQKYKLKDDVPGYLHAATAGHPGMIGLILGHFDLYFPQLPDHIRHARVWSSSMCNEAIVENDALMDWFGRFGRGLWTVVAEERIIQNLCHPFYSDIKFSDVANALREVAIRPRGYTRQDKGFDALTFCYRMGFIHKEPARPGSKETTYMFASPIHRRVAYRRLFPGPELGTTLDRITLPQACLNAVQRFSPSVLQARSTDSRSKRDIPEAALQDEMYCCLSRELRNLPILSEYSHTRNGRIDFYIFDKKWGIEILHCRSKRDVTEHIARFRANGKYRVWNILEDYIVLNFCSKSNIRDLEIKDSEVQPHILQVVLEPEEYKAEIYTHDKKLRATLTLGEGRERSRRIFFNSSPPSEKPDANEMSNEGEESPTFKLQQQEMLQDQINVMIRERKEQQERERERERLHEQREQELEAAMRRLIEEREQEREQREQEREAVAQRLIEEREQDSKDLQQQMEEGRNTTRGRKRDGEDMVRKTKKARGNINP